MVSTRLQEIISKCNLKRLRRRRDVNWRKKARRIENNYHFHSSKTDKHIDTMFAFIYRLEAERVS